MKYKPFFVILFLFFVFSLAFTSQSATGSCATKKTKLNIKKLTLTKNDTYTLRVYNLKKKQTIKFVSGDENIVTVKESGANKKAVVVTAVNVGTTTVRANVYNKKSKLVRTMKTTIRVTPLAASIKFTQKNIQLTVSEIMKLAVSIKPNTSFEVPLYESSDPDVVTVNSKGIITAIAPGNATITATLLSSGQKATCEVLVLPPAEETPEPEPNP